MNQTESFLAQISELYAKPIPDAVLERAKESLLDYIAVSAAGVRFLRDKTERSAAFLEPDSGDITVIGSDKKLALKEAVFLNGLYAHALDFDDGTNAGIIHLGSPIFALLLPLAERFHKTVDNVLRAAVIGYETSFTMAVSIQPMHKGLGFHATGTCGILGAVIAASYLLGFTDEERKQSFAAACAASSGMLMVLDSGSELKPYNAAKTALLALTALQLGKGGFCGHPDPLGGSRCFFKMMTGSTEVQMKPLLLNGTYAIQKTYTKPYAACRYCHPSIEAAVTLREKGIAPDNIEKVEIRTYSLAVSGHDHTEILGSASAKMSIPYSVAVGFIYGKAGLQEYDESIVQNGKVLALTGKVQVSADDAMSEAFPAEQSAELSVLCKDGSRYTERVDFPKGEPENPLTEAEFLERYTELMRYGGIAEDRSRTVYDAVMQKNSSVRMLMSLI